MGNIKNRGTMYDWFDKKVVGERIERWGGSKWRDYWMYSRGRRYPTYISKIINRASKYKGWMTPKECEKLKDKIFDKYGYHRLRDDTEWTDNGYPGADICVLCGRPKSFDKNSMDLAQESKTHFLFYADYWNNNYTLTKVDKCDNFCREVTEYWDKIKHRTTQERVYFKLIRHFKDEFLGVHILNEFLKKTIREKVKNEKNRKDKRRTKECTI